MSDKIFVAVLEAYDPDLPGIRQLYFCDGEGFNSKPMDTPAHQEFEPRIKKPVSMRQNIFSSGATSGQSDLAFGELVLSNNDRELDPILEYGIDGRLLSLYYGDPAEVFPSAWQLTFAGTMEQMVSEDEKTIVVKVRDRQFDTRRPIQSTLYLGSNLLPAGMEGVSDIRGKPKPLVFGSVFNVLGVLVNTSQRIYQFASNGCSSIAVYDNGIALTPGTARASQAALEAGTPGAGSFDYWLAGGAVKIASNPAGLLTADVVEGSVRTRARLFERILLWAGFSGGEIDSAALTLLDSLDSGEMGIYVDANPRDLGNILDEVAEPSCWWGQTPEGLFTIARPEDPSDVGATASAFFINEEIFRLKRLTPSDRYMGLPSWRTVLNYQKNYTPQSSDNIASTVALTRRAFLEREYRSVSADDTSVKLVHLNAPVLEFNSLYTTEAAAQTEVSRIQALRGVRKARYDARVRLDQDSPQQVRPGGLVHITHSRYNLSGGKLFTVLGTEYDRKKSTLNMTLWG